MTNSIAALFVAFFNLGATLYYLYMIYVTVGQALWGGMISTISVAEMMQVNDDINDTWIYLNFNDFFSSF